MNARHCVFAASGAMVSVATIVAAISAQPAATISFPHDYRSWQHVKSIVVGPEHTSFARRGGMHHYYANKIALEGYRTGTFPNGSVIVDEGVSTKDGEGQAKGILLESGRRSLDVMMKNDKVYTDTGGWAFEHFDGEDTTGRLDAKGRTTCYECHSKQKDRDHVFSTIRP
jgi:cytochrome P460